MLWNASAINGYAIAASDGEIGTVSDFLFDDTNWSVRWLVVDTGHWLSGRKVLLPPSVVGQVDPNKQEFSVKLTMQQVKDSPEIDTDRPVSRQMETNVYDYYGWRALSRQSDRVGGAGRVTMLHDPSLLSPTSLPAIDHPARDLAVPSVHAQLSRRRGSPGRARARRIVRDGATLGPEIRSHDRAQSEASPSPPE
jgi:hypothetical protein